MDHAGMASRSQRIRARHTDHIKLTRALIKLFREKTNPPDEGGCTTWRAEGRRHIDVEIYGQVDHGICCVQRLAYAIAHMGDRGPSAFVAEDEEVTCTCGTQGNANTGDGACVNPAHLVKGKRQDRVAYTRELRHLKRAAAAMSPRQEAA